MKEAAGEANMTVITIILIAIVLGIGTLVVTNLMNKAKNSDETMNATSQAACEADPTYEWKNGLCQKRG